MAKILVANWKMNPMTAGEAQRIFDGFKNKSSNVKNVKTVFCPPFIYIDQLKKSYTGSRISFGAQDAFVEDSGARTGETSPLMLRNMKLEYVIVGHSERRELGEKNSLVAKKVKAVLKNKMKPILCVGEPARDRNGAYLKFLKKEILESLEGVSRNDVKNVVIAYEPIWAIGARQAMTSSDLHTMTIYIYKVLAKKYGRKVAGSIKILYGGSVTDKNAGELVKEGNVDGLLVGRASLDAETFAKLAKAIQ